MDNTKFENEDASRYDSREEIEIVGNSAECLRSLVEGMECLYLRELVTIVELMLQNIILSFNDQATSSLVSSVLDRTESKRKLKDKTSSMYSPERILSYSRSSGEPRPRFAQRTGLFQFVWFIESQM